MATPTERATPEPVDPQELEHYKREYAWQRLQRNAADEDNEKLRAQLADKDRQIAELTAERDEAQKWAERLEQEQKASRQYYGQERLGLMQAIEHRESVVNQRDETIRQRAEQIAALTQQNEQLHDAIDAFKRTDHDHEGAADVWEEIAAAARAELTALRQQLAEWEQEIADTKTTCGEYERRMDMSSLRANKAERERDTLWAALANYMAAFGQALEAHEIPYGRQQEEADRMARAALASSGAETPNTGGN